MLNSFLKSLSHFFGVMVGIVIIVLHGRSPCDLASNGAHNAIPRISFSSDVRRFPEQVRADSWRQCHHPDAGEIAMSTQERIGTLLNGPGAAAILAAGIGCAILGILAFAGDASDASARR
jgi:hypothetical protein